MARAGFTVDVPPPAVHVAVFEEGAVRLVHRGERDDVFLVVMCAYRRASPSSSGSSPCRRHRAHTQLAALAETLDAAVVDDDARGARGARHHVTARGSHGGVSVAVGIGQFGMHANIEAEIDRVAGVGEGIANVASVLRVADAELAVVVKSPARHLVVTNGAILGREHRAHVPTRVAASLREPERASSPAEIDAGEVVFHVGLRSAAMRRVARAKDAVIGQTPTLHVAIFEHHAHSRRRGRDIHSPATRAE